MGSHWSIAIPPPHDETALAGLPQACSALLEDCENRLSRWRDGPVSRLNRCAGKQAIDPGPETWRLLIRLGYLSRITDGAFDILLGRLVDLWGFGPGGRGRGQEPPNSQQVQSARDNSGMRHLRLYPARKKARILCGGAIMDLGGAGKGVALEMVGTLLRSRGIRNALVDLGGSSMLALGRPPGESGWIIALAATPTEKPDARICLRDRCLTTSGTTIARGTGNSGTYGHLIHPRQGDPVPSGVRVSVVTRLELLGEIIATAWPLMNPGSRRDLLKRYPGIHVITFPRKGEIREVPGPVPGLRFNREGRNRIRG